MTVKWSARLAASSGSSHSSAKKDLPLGPGPLPLQSSIENMAGFPLHCAKLSEP